MASFKNGMLQKFTYFQKQNTDYKRKIIFVNVDLKNQNKINVNDSFEIKQNFNNFMP